MSEKENELANTTPGMMAAAPDFMAGDREGQDVASEYRTTAYSKIVQSSSKNDLKEMFPEGSVILTPENTLVAPKGEEFVVIPIFMFTTYEKWKHLDDKIEDGMGVVIDKTTDKNSDLAARAKDFNRMFEDYPDGRTDRNGVVMRYRYVESINVIFYIDHCDASPELVGSPFFYSFMKGEFKTGRRFCTSVARRNKSIFGCRFALKTEIHKSKDGENDWYGFAVNNPTEEQGGAWVTSPDQYEQLKDAHKNFGEAVTNGLFDFNRDDGHESDGPKTGEAAGGFDGMPPA